MAWERQGLRFYWVAAFYLGVLIFCARWWLTAGSEPGWLAWALSSLFIIGLYGALSLIALSRRPNHVQVKMFVLAGVAASLAMIWPPIPEDLAPSWLFCILFVARVAVLMLSPAVYFHLAAVIPRRNPLILRYPALLTGGYLLGLGLTFAVTVILITEHFHLLPGSWDAAQISETASPILLFFSGLFSLGLLAYAARRESAPAGRWQVLLVFCGFLLWTLSFVWLGLFPGLLQGASWAPRMHLVAVPLVAISTFAAIFGIRLLAFGNVIRGGLIYGTVTGIMVAVVYLLVAGSRSVAGQPVGLTPRPWQTAVGLVLAAVAFQPLLRRIAAAVDRAFFPEKERLRDLQHSIIPELAELTDIETSAEHVVRRVRETVDLQTVALFLADEERNFYRARALAGDFVRGDAAAGAVLTRAELEGWLELRGSKPFERRQLSLDSRGAAERAEMLDLVEARYIVPVSLRDKLVGLLALSAPRSGAALDRVDLGRLEILAHGAAAMLENARLVDLATRDALTGLPLRRVFQERLEVELSRSRRLRMFHPFAIGLADVDGFKGFNDTHGHLMGDRVLRAVGDALSRGRRTIDTVARYGGDEFGLLFLETNREGVLTRAARLLSQVAAELVVAPEGEPVQVTISIGLCMVTESDAAFPPEELVHRADAALYGAKRGGKNRLEIYGAGEAEAVEL